MLVSNNTVKAELSAANHLPQFSQRLLTNFNNLAVNAQWGGVGLVRALHPVSGPQVHIQRGWKFRPHAPRSSALTK
jgi:hypothetical protein